MELHHTHQLRFWTLHRPIFWGEVALFQEGEEVGKVGFAAGVEGILIGPTEELQLQIRPPWQGNGYGTRLIQGTVEYITGLIDHYDFSPRRLYAYTLKENIPARKTLEENGFAGREKKSYVQYEKRV